MIDQLYQYIFSGVKKVFLFQDVRKKEDICRTNVRSMSETKQKILNTAFILFLSHGYSNVSITKLQKKLGLGRASLYHYFESKEALFEAVIEKFMFNLSSSTGMALDQQLTIPDMIQLSISEYRHTMKTLRQVAGNDVTVLNYWSLVFEAMKYFKKIKKEMAGLQEMEFALWKNAVQNSMSKGEVQADLDLEKVALMFIGTGKYFGLVATFKDRQQYIESDTLEMYQYIYDMIRS